MMKADVLNVFDEIKVCTHYERADGTLTEKFPYEIEEGSFKPIYKTFKGWNRSLENIHEFDNLPEELLNYIEFIEGEVNLPINIVSVGPDRTQTIIRNQVLA